jgi:hypothetical protein
MLYKKIVGTFVFLFMILGISLIGYYFTQAKFINNQNLLEFDGLLTNTLSDNGDYSISLKTSGAGTITVIANGSTNYVGSLTYGDIDKAINIPPFNHNMRLRVVADIVGNQAYAKSVKRIDGEGYGFAGDHVQIARATVTGIDIPGKKLIVDSGVAMITFHINNSTGFSGTTFSTLQIGEVVQIHGRDSGSYFLANLVVLKEKKIKTTVTK